uniref:Uncharacterized protein n=1 Tax=Denticeps clupeoides TaxID=299321 RepID=A0AAY4EBZ0_9TELE
MPKEQGFHGERGPRMASKNAKDKSNSATLLASRAKAHAEQKTNGRGSRCSSEKDSGYSDTGSDSLQTDAEDQQSSVSKPQGREGHQGPIQGSHILVSGTPELTPIFIIKNVVLKRQVEAGQEHLFQTPLSWASGGTNGQGPTHVLLLQQPPVTSPPPVHVLKPQPRRADGGSKKSKAPYLPILNSYPRIAPHPSKKTPDKATATSSSAEGSVTSEDHSLSKRVCTEEKREEVSTTSKLPKQHLHKQSENRAHSHSSHSLPRKSEFSSHPRRRPCLPSSPTTSLSVGSPSVSSTETTPPTSSSNDNPPTAAPPLQASRGQRRHSSSSLFSSARHRRFLNTVEILSQSGLLDITLRTQELLRQSTATERDIAQLRQHAQLLCQAAQTNPDSFGAWERVQHAMAESGHYPSLKCLVAKNGDSHAMQVAREADTSVVFSINLILLLNGQ